MNALPPAGDDMSAIIVTLTIVGDVIKARHAVEAAHGTRDEAAAIAALGDELTHLEEAFEVLRQINERNSIGA